MVVACLALPLPKALSFISAVVCHVVGLAVVVVVAILLPSCPPPEKSLMESVVVPPVVVGVELDAGASIACTDLWVPMKRCTK